MRVTLLRFRLNRSKRGIAGVAVSPKVRAALHHIAETKAKPFAVAASPEDSGTYAGSWRVHDVTVRGIPREWPMTRAGVDLVNHDPGATAIEVGTARRTRDGGIVATPANWVLRKTLQHLQATSGVTRGGRR